MSTSPKAPFSATSLLTWENFSKFLLLAGPIIGLFLLLIPTIKHVAAPFMFGIVTAYILKPIVNFLSTKLHLPRKLTVVVVYLLFVMAIIFLINQLVNITTKEIKQLTSDAPNLSNTFSGYVKLFPEWGRGFAQLISESLNDLPRFFQSRTMPVVTATIETVVSLFIYFISAFYVLKDYQIFELEKIDPQLTKNIGETIRRYFRSQFILVLIMTALTWLFLTILQVRYALLLSMFTGIAEVVPYIGPFTAAFITIITALITGHTIFATNFLALVAVLAVGYFVLRQLEDFFVIPLILGKSLELHPLVVLFTTILAGKLYGIIGLLFGVPFIASYRIIVKHVLEERKQA